MEDGRRLGCSHWFPDDFPHRKLEFTGVDEPTLLDGPAASFTQGRASLNKDFLPAL